MDWDPKTELLEKQKRIAQLVQELASEQMERSDAERQLDEALKRIKQMEDTERFLRAERRQLETKVADLKIALGLARRTNRELFKVDL